MTLTADPATAQQAANNRGITIGTEVHGDLGRPGTTFTGRVVEIYAVHLGGFEVPAVKVQTADGSMRYTLLGDVALARGDDDAEEPRTPEEFAAMLGDIEAEAIARRAARPTKEDPMTMHAVIHRWIAAGTTDDITECDHCGRTDLKNTVRMITDSGDEQYMGVVCAARMTGRPVKDIISEATRADRARKTAIRDAHRQWSEARSRWFCTRRDAALGAGASYPEIVAWRESPDQRAAESVWLAEHPEPARP